MGGAAAWPRVIISLPVAQHQVVGSGGGGRRRFFRVRGALLSVALFDFLLPSVSDGGRGMGVRRTDAVVVTICVL